MPNTSIPVKAENRTVSVLMSKSYGLLCLGSMPIKAMLEARRNIPRAIPQMSVVSRPEARFTAASPTPSMSATRPVFQPLAIHVHVTVFMGPS